MISSPTDSVSLKETCHVRNHKSKMLESSFVSNVLRVLEIGNWKLEIRNQSDGKAHYFLKMAL